MVFFIEQHNEEEYFQLYPLHLGWLVILTKILQKECHY